MFRYLTLYVAFFAAFGVVSPFLPSFLSDRGLSPTEISVLLATGTAVRLLSAPIAAQFADRNDAPRAVLISVLGASALVALLYLPARTFVVLAGVSLLHAAVLAPLTPTADAMALGQRKAFDYGWVRGAGSAAFVAGTFLSGFAIDRVGLTSTLYLNAGCLALAAAWACLVPVSHERTTDTKAKRGDMRVLLKNPIFLLMLLVAALVLSSHAMHDAFAVIRWRAAGLSNTVVSTLWSEAVVSEVIVFTVVGPLLLRVLSPATCAAIAALAGVARWIVVSQTLSPLIIGTVEPLHGLTFALLHLSCMRIIAQVVPAGLATSAQAVYGTVAVGGASALVTLASGLLYEHLGGTGFLIMSALCLAAIPAALLLRHQMATVTGGPAPAVPSGARNKDV